MDSSTIRLDRGLFGDEVVTRTAHRYSGQFHVSLHAEDAEIVVVLTTLDGSDAPADTAGRFQNDVLDEQLRQIVRRETHEIHSQLISAALREAAPQRSGASS
jgi:His-Xaa-Ser system protein HxsD